MGRPAYAFRSTDLRRHNRYVYTSRPGSLSWRLNAMDRGLYHRNPEVPEVILPEDIWQYWADWGRDRIRNGRDIIVVIDADSRSGGITRIGKSTLGVQLLREWDPTFNLSTIRERYAASASDLARFELTNKPGQGVLYDEGMWGARGREAMTPENRMIGEILGTLASRQAIVVMCTGSMLDLDPSVRRLTHLRLIVRYRGLAEAHTPKVHFDLERTRLLPFREHEMSPLLWEPLDGPIATEYEAVKREAQDKRIRLKLQEQAVYEARQLGQRPGAGNAYITEGDRGDPTPRARWPCRKCGKGWGGKYERDRHEVRCKSKAAEQEPTGPV